jgi:small subunit ribosomal protein S9
MTKVITQKGDDRYQTTGRRKRAVARIFLQAGDGKIKVNDRTFENYFIRETHRLLIMQPFNVTNTKDKFDVMANVNGGGMTGQALAVRHGISRALVQADEAYKKALKTGGFLTRDARRKERKKYGQKRARKRFQYSKR